MSHFMIFYSKALYCNTFWGEKEQVKFTFNHFSSQQLFILSFFLLVMYIVLCQYQGLV